MPLAWALTDARALSFQVLRHTNTARRAGGGGAHHAVHGTAAQRHEHQLWVGEYLPVHDRANRSGWGRNCKYWYETAQACGIDRMPQTCVVSCQNRSLRSQPLQLVCKRARDNFSRKSLRGVDGFDVCPAADFGRRVRAAAWGRLRKIHVGD